MELVNGNAPDRALYLERRAAVLTGADTHASNEALRQLMKPASDSNNDHSKLRSLGYAMAAAALHVIAASLVLRPAEGWSWLDCAYFCIVSLTTVG